MVPLEELRGFTVKVGECVYGFEYEVILDQNLMKTRLTCCWSSGRSWRGPAWLLDTSRLHLLYHPPEKIVIRMNNLMTAVSL